MRQLGWVSVLLLAGMAQAAAPPMPPRGTGKVVIVSGSLVACLEPGPRTLHHFAVVGIPDGGLRCRYQIDLGDIGGSRWHVGHGGFWFNALGGFGRSPQGSAESIKRLELDDLAAGRQIPTRGAGAYAQYAWMPAFGRRSPGDRARTLREVVAFEFEPFTASEMLPVGPREVRHFLLASARGSLAPAASTGALGALKIRVSPEDRKTPHWSFTVSRCKQDWNEKERGWEGGPWKQEESLVVAFHELFRVVGKGDDYFFVTDSGRLFHSPPGPKGKPRPVNLVWADDRRIEAILTHADTGRTFVFCHPARLGEKPVYFEVSDRPRTVEYDPASVARPKAEGELRRLLIQARVLVADGKVRLAEPKKER